MSHWVCWVLKLNVMYYSGCTVFINSHTFHEWLLYVMYFMYWLLLCGIKWLNLWSFKARFYLSIGPELSKKWIFSDLPLTRETETNVYFSILQNFNFCRKFGPKRHLVKVWMYWEGHKIRKNLPLSIWRYSVASNKF